jgi:DNA-binding MurR/RpiR family transcriptional regulator
MPSIRKPATPTASATVDSFLARIGGEFEQLSRQLKQIAKYVEQHRDHIALERVQDVAARCAVQPSAVIRFAKHFGFSGWSEMQKIFRDGVAQRIAPSRNYQERIREAIDSAQGRLTAADIAQEFISGSIAGLQELQRDLHPSTFGEAVDLLAGAETIWLVGSRRAFPVASYLAYALQHTDKRIQLLHGVGSMNEGHLRSLRAGDVLLVVSFAPYAAETVLATQIAREAGAQVIALTDSRMSPLAAEAHVALLVHESSTFGFRSLTTTMGLAQSLFIALAHQLELDYQPISKPVPNRSPT